ncbi:MAG: FAD-dependent oxidoreductase, partial [Proteobacteria bacterium]|nr:FAD-dependent oxidoreductase [Pseudomonadota bacterium]
AQKIGKDDATAIFYMDMRTFGRDFQRYRDRAEHTSGVRFVRCRIHSIEPAENEGDLKISYVDSFGKLKDECFDMAVLSTGRHPKHKLPEFAGREGVYHMDSAAHFMDISAAVIGAGRTSESVGRMLHRLGVNPEGLPTDIFEVHAKYEEAPRLQIVLCACGQTLNRQMDWDRIEAEIKNLPGSFDIVRMNTVCDRQGWDEMLQILDHGSANRLLLASCNPLVYLPRLKELHARTGILPSLVEVINLRRLADQAGDPVQVSDAVISELEMSIRRLLSRIPVEPVVREVSKNALVVGAGPAGLAAALALAARNIPVVLVEKSDRLGGNLVAIRPGETRAKIEKLVAEADRHARITIHYNTEVMHSFGRPGRFVTRIRHKNGDEVPVIHGAAILATGGKTVPTSAYAHGQNDKIISIFELEKRLDHPEFAAGKLRTAVFIQCVDSREEPRNYCSRICCLKSLTAAIKVRKLHPQAQVYVFYRDMMTYGDSEAVYTEARRSGVMFVPFAPDAKPGVRVDEDRVVLEGWDPLLGEPICLQPDLVVLATGIVPHPVEDLVSIFKVETTPDGFLKEADSKWRPVDSGREGIFVCGLARAPARADEAMAEGRAAAQRALRILSKDLILSPRQVARVRHAICSLCETCIQVCPYHARYVDSELGLIMVDPVACQGCGVCAADCPNSATIMGCFEENGILNAIEAAL